MGDVARNLKVVISAQNNLTNPLELAERAAKQFTEGVNGMNPKLATALGLSVSLAAGLFALGQQTQDTAAEYGFLSERVEAGNVKWTEAHRKILEVSTVLRKDFVEASMAAKDAQRGLELQATKTGQATGLSLPLMLSLVLAAGDPVRAKEIEMSWYGIGVAARKAADEAIYGTQKMDTLLNTLRPKHQVPEFTSSFVGPHSFDPNATGWRPPMIQDPVMTLQQIEVTATRTRSILNSIKILAMETSVRINDSLQTDIEHFEILTKTGLSTIGNITIDGFARMAMGAQDWRDTMTLQFKGFVESALFELNRLLIKMAIMGLIKGGIALLTGGASLSFPGASGAMSVGGVPGGGLGPMPRGVGGPRSVVFAPTIYTGFATRGDGIAAARSFMGYLREAGA